MREPGLKSRAGVCLGYVNPSKWWHLSEALSRHPCTWCNPPPSHGYLKLSCVESFAWGLHALGNHAFRLLHSLILTATAKTA